MSKPTRIDYMVAVGAAPFYGLMIECKVNDVLAAAKRASGVE